MTDSPYAVTASEAGDAIFSMADAFLRTGNYQPCMLWGDSGVGKTEGVAAAAKRLKARLVTIHVADREPTELGGLYWVVDGEVRRLSPDDLPLLDGEPTILFFDELPQAPMMNKNIIARIVNERRAGNFRLGNKAYVCCAGNYARNRAGTSAMPAHLNLRLTHYDVVPDRDGWNAWAVSHGVSEFVTSFVRYKPEYFHAPNPDVVASPNPRAWDRVSRIEAMGMTGQVRKAAIVGTVGKEAGTAYLDREELLRLMPDPDEVIANPTTAEVPTDRAVLFALTASLAARAKPSNIGAIITYTNRLEGNEEYQVMCISDAKGRNPTVAAAKEYRNFILSARGQSLT